MEPESSLPHLLVGILRQIVQKICHNAKSYLAFRYVLISNSEALLTPHQTLKHEDRSPRSWPPYLHAACDLSPCRVLLSGTKHNMAVWSASLSDILCGWQRKTSCSESLIFQDGRRERHCLYGTLQLVEVYVTCALNFTKFAGSQKLLERKVSDFDEVNMRCW